MLRDYQSSVKAEIYRAWHDGHRRVLAVMPTGAGKTVTMVNIAADFNGHTVEIAHRQELVLQISMALAEIGIYHRIIAPEGVVRFIAYHQAKHIGQSFIHSGAHHSVASVDTLNARAGSLTEWFSRVLLAQMDECHHGLQANKWGKALLRFENALLLGWTATPCRSDNKALGWAHGGMFDHMVIGPSMRWLIDQGRLCPYRVFGPAISIDTAAIPVSESSGEFNPTALRSEAHKSTITGDLVTHYLKIAPGLLGAAFVVDVELAHETAQAFVALGVPAAVINGKTGDEDRTRIMGDFRCGLVRMIVNVDILNEGVDVPGIGVIMDGAPTMSIGRYRQRFGRCLRPAAGKSYGIYCDAAGNVRRHGMPDAEIPWSLEPQVRRRRKILDEGFDELSVVTCDCCLNVYERWKPVCPYCPRDRRVVNGPHKRDRPEQVDGDLLEYSHALMSSLSGEADKIMGAPRIPFGNAGARAGARVAHEARKEAQAELRFAIAAWAAIQRDMNNRSDSESYRLFMAKFGTDVLTAQTLGAPKARTLEAIIWQDLN